MNSKAVVVYFIYPLQRTHTYRGPVLICFIMIDGENDDDDDDDDDDDKYLCTACSGAQYLLALQS